MQTQINLKTLNAVALFASKEETRYYLNGVLIQCRADHVMYVATDGHRMMMVREEVPQAPKNGERAFNTLLGDFIVPSENCKHKSPKYDYQNFATLTRDGDVGLRLALADGSAKVFKPIDGSFPDYVRVIPESVSGNIEFYRNGKDGERQSVEFNPDYLVSFKKFGELMGLGLPHIALNGEAPAAVLFNAESILGVIMPMRGETQNILGQRYSMRLATVLGRPIANGAYSGEMLQAAE